LKEIHVSQKEGSKLGIGTEADKGTAEKRRDVKQKQSVEKNPHADMQRRNVTTHCPAPALPSTSLQHPTGQIQKSWSLGCQ